MIRKTLVAALVGMAVASPGLWQVAHAAKAQTINITLEDPSTAPSISGMEMKADKAKVKSGRVTLRAVNRSKDLVHEVLVIPAPPNGKQLPYDDKTNTIDEKAAHSRGEISELKPGAHGSVTLNLKPGAYLLVCNQPGHYKAGMFTRLMVEK